jgi:hypothetical protein
MYWDQQVVPRSLSPPPTRAEHCSLFPFSVTFRGHPEAWCLLPLGTQTRRCTEQVLTLPGPQAVKLSAATVVPNTQGSKSNTVGQPTLLQEIPANLLTSIWTMPGNSPATLSTGQKLIYWAMLPSVVVRHSTSTEPLHCSVWNNVQTISAERIQSKSSNQLFGLRFINLNIEAQIILKKSHMSS